MNRQTVFSIVVSIILYFSTTAYSEFRFQEVRVMGGISQTKLKLATIIKQPDILPSEKSGNKYGLPIGLRFGLGDFEKGWLIGLGGFVQPIFSGNEYTKYYIQPDVLGSGSIEHSYWDLGVLFDLIYRFKKIVPGLFLGGGISGHRITAKSTFNPPFYIFPDIPIPLDILDNGEFRTGFQVIVGFNLVKGLDIEGRYEFINDFNQLKIGLTVALWRHE